VSVKYYTANTWKRIFAYLTDGAIISILILPVLLKAFQSYAQNGFFELSWKWLVVGFVLQFLYKWLFLKLLGGTLGKLLFALRVVSVNGESQLTWMQSFLRVFTDHFSIFFGKAPQAFMFYRFDRRHLSDWIAETRVVQFFPRRKYPHRRIFLATFLVIYLGIGGFLSAYKTYQNTEIFKWGARFHPKGIQIEK
jgi:uncharacterized RDD family membrane protein YckC